MILASLCVEKTQAAGYCGALRREEKMLYPFAWTATLPFLEKKTRFCANMPWQMTYGWQGRTCSYGKPI